MQYSRNSAPGASHQERRPGYVRSAACSARFAASLVSQSAQDERKGRSMHRCLSPAPGEVVYLLCRNSRGKLEC